MIMDNLEKIFDDVIKSRKEEKELREKYFSDLHTKALGFINSAYRKLLFLNEKGFKVYKINDDSMYFYIDYPCGNNSFISRVTSNFESYTYLGETRSYPRTDDGFVVFLTKCNEVKEKYKTLEELVKAYAEKVKMK